LSLGKGLTGHQTRPRLLTRIRPERPRGTMLVNNSRNRRHLIKLSPHRPARRDELTRQATVAFRLHRKWGCTFGSQKCRER